MVAAYGGPQFQVTQQVLNRFAEAIQESRVDVVPQVVVGGGNGDSGATGSNIMEGLLTLLLSEKLGTPVDGGRERQRSPEANRLREEIRQSMLEKKNGQDQPAGPDLPATA